MLDPKEIESLLSKLCVDLGFCLPPEASERIAENPPEEIDDFTDAVFVAEGLDPENADRHLYRQVRAKIAEAFRRHDQTTSPKPNN